MLRRRPPAFQESTRPPDRDGAPVADQHAPRGCMTVESGRHRRSRQARRRGALGSSRFRSFSEKEWSSCTIHTSCWPVWVSEPSGSRAGAAERSARRRLASPLRGQLRARRSRVEHAPGGNMACGAARPGAAPHTGLVIALTGVTVAPTSTPDLGDAVPRSALRRFPASSSANRPAARGRRLDHANVRSRAPRLDRRRSAQRTEGAQHLPGPSPPGPPAFADFRVAAAVAGRDAVVLFQKRPESGWGGG